MAKHLSLLLALLLASCSSIESPAPPSEFHPDYIELFMSRASLTAAEFEQYKATPGGIFAECGPYSRGRSIPEHQTFEAVDANVRDSLNAAAWDVYSYLQSHPQGFAEPGKSDGMFDPGQVFLTIEAQDKKTEVKTSVNSIANMDGVAETKIRRLVRILRGAPASPECSKSDFYGIGAPIRANSDT